MSEQDAIALLQQLVEIPSVSGEERAAAEFLAAAMERRGLDAHVDAVGNAVGVRACPDDQGAVSREVVLLGHIDTVPGEIPARVENGRLYGRGSVDAKGPLATFAVAAARAKLAPGTRVVVVGAVEEEAATSKGARHVATQYRPDLCIIGEPSGWDAVTLGYKGRLLLDAEFRREMGHTAGPEIGVAETAVSFWNALSLYVENVNLGRDSLFDQLLPSLRDFNTGSDGLHNSAALTIGLRLPPEFDADTFKATVRQLAADTDADATLRFYAHEPAFRSGRANPLGRAFNRALRGAGVRPRYKLKTGTSDMNVVGPIWNCPIVAYGPGDSSLDHTPHEHLEIEEYVRAIAILTDVLNSICRE